MGAILFKSGFKCDRITQHLYLSGRTFAPGKLHRSSRIILLQQRLPTPTQLQAVGGGVGVAVAYQGKGTDLWRINCMVPVELCPSACKVILVIDIVCLCGLFPPSPISSQFYNQCSLSDVFL